MPCCVKLLPRAQGERDRPGRSRPLRRLWGGSGQPLAIRFWCAMGQCAPTRSPTFALSLVTPLQHLLEDASQLLKRPAFDPATATDVFRLSAADFFTEMLLPDLTARLERDAPG